MQPALYRAERPEVFEDIIGQRHIVRILQNQIRTGTVSQAYLFAGTHGAGKTSTARILAKAVNCTGTDFDPEKAAADGADKIDAGALPPCGHCDNCEAICEGSFVDVIELDAASNNGVDDLRSIIEMVKYPPALGRYKVFIIDEVHMLSTAAENAFLKTLEEPPAYAIFILATTDPQKVRATIRSRCMELNFRRVTEDELIAGMERICHKRGISATRDALATIASRADGSVRDALSILEQCMAAGDDEIGRSEVLEYTGAAGDDFFLALTGAVLDRDAGKALIYIDEIMKRGKDARQILKDWQGHLRDLMIVKYVGRAERIVGSSQENLSRLKALASRTDAAFIEKSIRLISEYINIGRYSERPRILLETAAVRLADPAEGATIGSAMHQSPRGGRLPQYANAPQASGTPQSSRHGAGGAPVFQSDAVGSSTLTQNRPAQQAHTADPMQQAYPEQPASSYTEQPAIAPVSDPGSPEDMWDRIVREVTNIDRSFLSMVGRHSSVKSFDSGELSVIVSPGKLRFAEDKSADIARIAKALYGSDVFVTIRAGEPVRQGAPEVNAGIPETEISGIIDNDINVNEVAEDVKALFGITPTILD